MYGMDGWHMGWGMWFWAIVLIGIIWLVVYGVRRNRTNGGSGESALEALKKRYARGEIDEEEFERMKRKLLS